MFRYVPQASPDSNPEWPQDISDRHPNQVGHEIRDTIAKLRGNSPKSPAINEAAGDRLPAPQEFRFGDSIKRPTIKPSNLEAEQQRLQAEALAKIKAKASGLPLPLDAVKLMRQKRRDEEKLAKQQEVDVTTKEAAERNEPRPEPIETTPPPPPPLAPIEPPRMPVIPDYSPEYKTAPYPPVITYHPEDFLPPEPQSFRPYYVAVSEFPPMAFPGDSDWIREEEDELIGKKVRQFIKQKQTDLKRPGQSPKQADMDAGYYRSTCECEFAESIFFRLLKKKKSNFSGILIFGYPRRDAERGAVETSGWRQPKPNRKAERSRLHLQRCRLGLGAA